MLKISIVFFIIILAIYSTVLFDWQMIFQYSEKQTNGQEPPSYQLRYSDLKHAKESVKIAKCANIG